MSSLLNRKVTVKPDLVARNNDDGTIVVMKMDESNLFFKIDGVAADVWKGLNDNKDLNQIFSEIQNSYDVSEEDLKKDVESFLNDLKGRDLIELN